MNRIVFSSASDEWETPDELFRRLDDEFHFTLDAAATAENAKVGKYYTREDNALLQDWGGETVFVNPPYSRALQDAFVMKCYEESHKPDTVIVALLPARTDTERFHSFIYGKAEIRFIRGRIKFCGSKNNAPFPSMIVIWRCGHDQP